jgi:hypothetical protein
MYAVVKGFLVGPYSPKGSIPTDVIEFRHPADNLIGRKGIYGENDVSHYKSEADVKFISGAHKIVPAPTVDFPKRIIVRGTHPLYPYLTLSLTAENGFGHNGAYVYRRYSGNIQHDALEVVGETLRFYQAVTHVNAEPGKNLRAELHEYRFNRFDGANIIFNTQLEQRSSLHGWDGGSHSESSLGGVKAAYSSFPGVSPGYVQTRSNPGTARIQMSRVEPEPFTLSNARGFVNAALDHLALQIQYFPLEDMHFGDLAMKASLKTNRLNINLIEFISELRNPKRLIPKLKNLKNLKTHAGNYLSFKFGVMPTVSDLQHILAAMHKRQPYYDKNGFQSVHSGHTESLTVNNIEFTLDQRIKLAIANEDQLFELLDAGLENMGALPNLANVWDLIPFSFAIDWFVGVGDLLERVDTHQRLTRLNIRYVTQSRNKIAKMYVTPSSLRPFAGSLEAGVYLRWVSDQCPTPPLSLKTTFQDFNSWLEAGALIIQRSKI